MNLEKLVSSEASYSKLKDKTLEFISNDSEKENVLRNIVLFCKQVFSSNTNQRKKYLCLLLIKDIFENLNSGYYEKLVDEYLALKLFQVVQTHLEGKGRESRTGNEDKELSEKVYEFCVETIVFWAKRLSFLIKSAFSQVYEELKKLRVEIPHEFTYYRKDMLIDLWKADEKEPSNESSNPIVAELNQKFKNCKEQLEKSINEAVINDSDVATKPIVESLREYLLYFFSNYRSLESEETNQRDLIIVYFHILNNMYKRVCNQIFLTIQEMIAVTKEIFEISYPAEYDSVDRMDMVELAGVFKYNALTVFQRIHQRIEKEDAILGPLKIGINLEQGERPSLPSAMMETNGSASRISRMESHHKLTKI